MAKVVKLSKYAKKAVKPPPKGLGKASSAKAPTFKVSGAKSGAKDIDHFINTAGLDTRREKEIGQHIGYRYDVNLLPDYSRLTPFLKAYLEYMGWDDLNWLEDVHMGYEEGEPAIFDRNCNGWVRIPNNVKLPAHQQDRDMMARELLLKFQMSPDHPMVELNQAYRKF
jgi:hypothetical protein